MRMDLWKLETVDWGRCNCSDCPRSIQDIRGRQGACCAFADLAGGNWLPRSSLVGWEGSNRHRSKYLRNLAVTAFLCVCFQATLGGLRVTRETAGAIDVALVLRIVHGCVAQAFLCILVMIAVRLKAEATFRFAPKASQPLRIIGWCSVAVIYLQLIVGATMRHTGAGLAIPLFPTTDIAGHLLPQVMAMPIGLNFIHTRIGAVAVTLMICSLIWGVWHWRREQPHLAGPAALLGILLVAQVLIGVFVIWHLKPRTLTTIHVVNGAALLATSVLIAVRAGWVSKSRHTPGVRDGDSQVTV